MISYGIRILLLINNLKHDIPDVTLYWYADNAKILGTFIRIETYFNLLTCQGPGCRYYHKPSKSELIAHLDNIEAGKVLGPRHGFKVCTGVRYLGDYIGDDKYNGDWMRERTLTWDKNIIMIRKTTGEYSQESYAAVARAIQSESIFLQHVTWDTGGALAKVEKMLQETFLPCLLFGNTKTFLPIEGYLSTKPINKSVLVLLNPATPAKKKT